VADQVTRPVKQGSLFCLRARPQPWLDALVAGLAGLPTSRRLQAKEQDALWMRLGPDEWWCWAKGGDTRDWPDRVRQAAGTHHHALVDISDAYQTIEVHTAAHALLSQGCELDLERLPADFAGRTRCAAFTVVLCPFSSGALLWAEASLAQSLERWLDRAAVFVRD
jgi:heterotetrameric sarcosine oxidase gamma subunit